MRFKTVSTMIFLIAAIACDDAATASVQPPAAPANGSVAFVAVSNTEATAGSEVTITAIVHNDAAVSSVGAFTAKLNYDPAGLTYVGEHELTSGMRAINAQRGQVIAAGASARGFDEGKLFSLTFKVVNPAALHDVALDITELSGTDFSNHVPKLSSRRGVFRTPAL
jgi:Cohesin domain.